MPVWKSSFKASLPHPHTHTHPHTHPHISHTVPPDPPTNLMATNIGETSLDLSWTNGFNGRSPITGVTVTIRVFVGLHTVTTLPLSGDSTLQTTQISSLAYREHIIRVTTNNAVGSSDPAEITVMTLSLSKCM